MNKLLIKKKNNIISITVNNNLFLGFAHYKMELSNLFLLFIGLPNNTFFIHQIINKFALCINEGLVLILYRNQIP